MYKNMFKWNKHFIKQSSSYAWCTLVFSNLSHSVNLFLLNKMLVTAFYNDFIIHYWVAAYIVQKCSDEDYQSSDHIG